VSDPDRSTLGRQLAALSSANQPHPVVCAQCGAAFRARNVRAAYCSNACRQLAKRRRATAERSDTGGVA